jgi:antitoxin (DNA-binding transcriptional repressor) of toxin-antitoxin stability system
MTYVISTVKDGVDYCITADKTTLSFRLIPVESDSDLSHVFSHPYQSGALNILRWIQDNDKELASEQLIVSDEGRFRY